MKEETKHTECKDNRRLRRDNTFGITWCIRCGRLFNKPCGKPLTKSDADRYNIMFCDKEKDVIKVNDNKSNAFINWFKNITNCINKLKQ